MSRGAAARFFLALGDETRLAILTQLRNADRAVNELVDALGCPQPKVSRHLKVLKEAGLVRDHRDGRRVIYSATTRASWSAAAREWVDRLEGGEEPEAPSERRAVARPANAPKPVPRSRRGGDLETHLL